ncbi:prepilin-type N-terminal cleavage/methylation domain-containing protein [Janthinobacterium sp. CG3]|uniref:prepilin-type N-terminal cleavage/methylation domain-containing protein n=1 Tax=Janthinobacterium sp. CG3 TaxID=1075768 RepID=UPI000349BE65|nr:prepilin-type N-terminal cleavage/methylation domain-containing protein [Janthinobacterium sp. CG3]
MNGAKERGQRGRRGGQAGFTLVEAVMVIVIVGIIGGIVAVFIRVPVQAYTDLAARAELGDIADTAVRRVGRDVRLALPNSVVASGDGRTMSFLLTKTGGRYQAVEDALAGGTPLDFENAAVLDFNVLGAMPAGQQAIVPGDFIVVYNLGPGYEPANANPAGGAPASLNVAAVAAVAGNVITMAANPFASANPVMSSPTSRFQVVTGTVTYVCDTVNRTLTRFWADRQLAAAGTLPPPGVGALLAENVSACAFNYVLPANTRSGLVAISLTLQRPGNAEFIKLFHQVHVDNTP